MTRKSARLHLSFALFSNIRILRDTFVVAKGFVNCSI